MRVSREPSKAAKKHCDQACAISDTAASVEIIPHYSLQIDRPLSEWGLLLILKTPDEHKAGETPGCGLHPEIGSGSGLRRLKCSEELKNGKVMKYPELLWLYL